MPHFPRPAAIAALILSLAPLARADTLADRIAHAWTFADQRMRQIIAPLPAPTASSLSYPDYTLTGGAWHIGTTSAWPSGLVPGSMWYLYDHTADPFWKTNATAWTLPLSNQTSAGGDIGFKVFDSFHPLYQQTATPAYRQYILDAAAYKQNNLWNATVGAFKTPGRNSSVAGANYGVLMDWTMDQELLFWAAKNNPDTTIGQTWLNRAIAHATKVADNLVRADGGSFQWGYFNSTSGALVSGETNQGYSNSSTWSRGQAWGIYGMTVTFRETHLDKFLTTARRLADYYIAHLPADSIPYWDFDPAAIASKPYRDSSAAAIAASALLELSGLETDPTRAANYRACAEATLFSLTSPDYLAEGVLPIPRGILQQGAYFVKNNAYEESLIWGDYYFLEALSREAALAPEPGLLACLMFLPLAGLRRRACRRAIPAPQ